MVLRVTGGVFVTKVGVLTGGFQSTEQKVF